jgi:hypothetical protein
MPGQTNFTAYVTNLKHDILMFSYAEHWNMPGAPDASQNFWYSCMSFPVIRVLIDQTTMDLCTMSF